ncbi:MAG: 23S rRNA (adenine(2503)-C(2))-methyltransferase RlmN [Lentisphaerae bacterium]|nr:23S rRNA (adenine(2503)-C(2))-methyltransferase RlmN [Lentisphaerota bacterium]
MNILSLTCKDLAAELDRLHGKGHYHARALYRDVFKLGRRTCAESPEFADAPTLAAQLAADLRFPDCRISAQHDDGSVLKFITTLADGETIESVLIPDKGRTTLCVSSQVGCRMGCKFCVTGQMGLRRHLQVEEIVWQLYAARFVLKRPVNNIVFMGMGEPLDNVEPVIQAVRVMADQRGLNLACSHMTVSTAGHVDGLRRLAAERLPNLRLAVSIHAANDALRNQLVPLNVRYPLARLKDALLAFPLPRRGVFFIEYVQLAGVNDSPEHAEALARYLAGLPVRVNVIPYNGGSSRLFVTPDRARVDQFCDALVAQGLFVRRRHPRGRNVMAACGQLGGVIA